VTQPKVHPYPVSWQVPERPRLKEGLTPVWRDEVTIQIGLDPSRATVLGDVSPEAAAVLRLLDGSRHRSELEEIGGPPVRELLALLAREGLLAEAGAAAPLADVDGDARRRCAAEIAALSLRHSQPAAGPHLFGERRRRRVVVHGAGRLGTGVAHLLAASGVGRVTVDDEARVRPEDVCPGAASSADVGLRRGAAATALTVRALPPAVIAGHHDVALICADSPLPPTPQAVDAVLNADTAVLPVTIRESTAIVGPFFVPGSIEQSGCPWCADLHRTDRDPQWPVICGQLRSAGVAGPPAATLVWATAALAAGQCLEYLDGLADGTGRSASSAAIACLGATLELAGAGWAWRRRWWGPHPDCRCRSPLRAAV